MNMIGPQEVLALFDIKMGYGTDDYSQKVLQKKWIRMKKENT